MEDEYRVFETKCKHPKSVVFILREKRNLDVLIQCFTGEVYE